MRHVLSIGLLALLLSSCNSTQAKVDYHGNGKIKVKYQILDNKLEGKAYYYRPDGSIEAIKEYKKGRKDGIIEYFYPNGILESRSFWKNSKPVGFAYTYYPNGNLKSKAWHDNDIEVITGEAYFYRQDGTLTEKRIHNKQGAGIYWEIFDAKGKSTGGLVVPVIYPEKDTIQKDEAYKLKIYFGLPLRGKLRILIREKEKKGETEPVKDTVAILENAKGENQFSFSFLPKKRGINVINFRVEHEKLPSDTLSANGFEIDDVFYVR